MESIESLLAVARDLNVHLAGVSFHCVQRAKTVFDLAPLYGHNDMRILDIGGGFPGSKLADIKFEQIAGILRTALSEYFPIDSGIQLIAEPGRYFVENAFTLAVNVIARRVVYDDKPEGENGVVTDSMTNDNGNSKPPSYMYYINDGMYGSFNCIMFDHVIMKTPGLLMREGQFHGRDHPHQRPEYLVNRETPTLSLIGFSDSDDDSVELSTPNEAMSVEGALMAASPMPPGYRCSIWGPTCDSIDCVNPRCVLPELRVGDWLRYDGMGAYTLCAASQFNGFKQSRVIYIDTTDTCLHTAATKNGNFH
ncbi:pyridoxal-dependent decarboxylase [Syncephalis fuscata]|nr:pyridoxal-dependent decarboxylase [Syncephalis fuscata]